MIYVRLNDKSRVAERFLDLPVFHPDIMAMIIEAPDDSVKLGYVYENGAFRAPTPEEDQEPGTEPEVVTSDPYPKGEGS